MTQTRWRAAAAACAMGLLAMPAAHAFECTESSREIATTWVEEMIDTGIMETLAPSSNTLRLAFSGRHWDAISLSRKEGIVGAMQCVIAGPGSVLAGLEVVDLHSGRLLANVINGRVYVPAR